MSSPAPRHHLARPVLSGAGLPDDRQARMAARRAFVNLKQTYIAAVADLPGPRADWLRYQIRHAAEPADLWLLRAAVFDALPAQQHREARDTLQRGIDSVFPSTSPSSGFAPLF
ncbi:MAG: hypothetical protein J0M00_18790 [Burkholderiales bacterium]|nr:hypothetical protein [Burkholderiales bacterium]